jgi:hypothetical protein
MSSTQMIVSMTRGDLEALVQSAVQTALNNGGIPVSGAVAVSGKKPKKEKRVKDPNAPKKDPNAWVNFTQHVRSVLLAGGCELKGFVGQQYCSVLKAKLPLLEANEKGKQEPDYSAVSDEEIVSGFKSWTPPEQSKASVVKASKASSVASRVPSAETSPVAVAPVAAPPSTPAPAATEKKKRAPQSAETKAAAALKRAATKAAKAANAEVPAAAAVVPPKPAGPKPVAAPVEEGDITEFAPTIIKGKPYIRNCRGDVMTEDYEWVGRYNEATKTLDTKFPKPEDLDE